MSSQTQAVDKKRISEILRDPVLFAQVFIRIYDSKQKKIVPWVARWYQVEMLRDKALRKVSRCGRRIGKTETMVIDMIHKSFTNRNYTVLVITPYESQVSLIFSRLREVIDNSPLLKRHRIRVTSNPYLMAWDNNSKILGFTTGASSGSAAASIRGQKADWIYLDEMDYMAPADFDTITSIAAERDDIGIFASSTPTGARGKFYDICTNPKLHYSQHYHPSMDNPNWNEEMESEFRAQLSPQGYVHEILAEFGVENAGVFNKAKVDESISICNYAYATLDYYQRQRVQESKNPPKMYMYSLENKAFPNYFRTVGVDWDKYQAGSSVLVLDYNLKLHKFQVLKRIEVPRSEYTFDNTMKIIMQVNEIYNPSWIYCDKGYGEYQIERLHLIGKEHPETGLDNKVRGWQFKENITVPDPVTGEETKSMMKHFMVNQLQMAFERGNMILSAYDEVLYKQLIDYQVVKESANGPQYTSKNEHFVDALGLAYLAFVLEFPKLTKGIYEPDMKAAIDTMTENFYSQGVKRLCNETFAESNEVSKQMDHVLNDNQDDLPGDRPTWVKVSPNYRAHSSSGDWGSRSFPSGGFSRSSW